MSERNRKFQTWQFNRQVNLSLFVQVIFLAALIVGTWVNLQKQLSLLQYDITLLIETQKDFQKRIEKLDRASICYEYRLRAIEKQPPKQL